MTVDLPHLSAERRAHRKVANNLVRYLSRQATQFDSAALSKRLGHFNFDRAVAYEELSRFASETLIKQTTAFMPKMPPHFRNGLTSGVDIQARLLALAPSAWRTYCGDHTDQPSDVTALSISLKASIEVVDSFLKLTNDTNRDAELAFGLRSELFATNSNLFAFHDTWRGPLFIPDDETYGVFKAAPHPIYDPTVPTGIQICPARQLVTTNIWPGLVDLAANTPEVFIHDLK